MPAFYFLGFIASPHWMCTELKTIDARFAKLFATGRVDAAQRAISHGDAVSIHAELTRCYGALLEVLCLRGPHRAKSILVFAGGVGLLAGADSYIPILTFGYVGQGSRTFSEFLSAAGFALTDASQFKSPLIVRRDGSTLEGVIHETEVRWQDGSTTPIPQFLGE